MNLPSQEKGEKFDVYNTECVQHFFLSLLTKIGSGINKTVIENLVRPLVNANKSWILSF